MLEVCISAQGRNGQLGNQTVREGPRRLKAHTLENIGVAKIFILFRGINHSQSAPVSVPDEDIPERVCRITTLALTTIVRHIQSSRWRGNYRNKTCKYQNKT